MQSQTHGFTPKQTGIDKKRYLCFNGTLMNATSNNGDNQMITWTNKQSAYGSHIVSTELRFTIGKVDECDKYVLKDRVTGQIGIFNNCSTAKSQAKVRVQKEMNEFYDATRETGE